MRTDAREILTQLWFGCVIVLVCLMGFGWSDIAPDPDRYLQFARESDLLRRAVKITLNVAVFAALGLPVWHVFVKPRLALLEQVLDPESQSRVLHVLFISALQHAVPVALLLSLVPTGLGPLWSLTFLGAAAGLLVWFRQRAASQVQKTLSKARVKGV